MDEKIVNLAKQSNYLDTLVYTGEIPFEFDNAIEVSREVLNKISKKEDLNYLGVGKHIKECDDYQSRVIVLDHLQDP